MSSLSDKELRSLVSDAVAEAMKVSALECPDCHATFTKPAQYMDHRIGEYINTKMAEPQPIDTEKLMLDCKDGICKLVDEHIKEKYNVGKQTAEEEEEPGLFTLKDDAE